MTTREERAKRVAAIRRTEPSGEALLAARLAWHEDSPRWAPTPYAIACLARDLRAIERAWRRHCGRCCCGPEDGGYSFPDGASDFRGPPEAQRRADARLRKRVAAWCARVPGAVIELEGDPRGPVLRIKLPGMTEAVAV